MNTIILASENAGKVAEIESLLAPLHCQVKLQTEFAIEAADETGLTFVENALIKARHAALHSGLPALADDSGIEVDALKGAPGIYSARFSGEGATDELNNAHLLAQLKNIPQAERTARYQCVLVYLRHAEDPTPIICQGSWEGRILTEPAGDGGFGYDPLFWVESEQCSAAQLTKARKSQLSHRAKALACLVEKLNA